MTQPSDVAERQAAIKDAVEGVVASMPPQIASAMRLGAIPHWFDEKLLNHLLGERVDASTIVARLQDLSFVRRDAQGNFRYHDVVRNTLLAYWRREASDEYKVANLATLNYWSHLGETAIGVERLVYEREVLYHQLIVDEAKGLSSLSQQFEAARGDYQLGMAEGLVAQATQLKDILTDTGRRWARYFEARLDLAYRRGDFGEAIFQDLADHGPDPILRAAAGWSLGEIQIRQQRWSQAVELYRTSLASLRREGALMYEARVTLALGNAYRDLAENSGGFQTEPEKSLSAASWFVYVLIDLPFLLYTWIAHRVSLLPNWYFGTNYQDWIIAYLLVEAARWYRRAERQLKDIGDTQGLVEVQIYLAELEHQLGNWPQAQRWYAMLLKSEKIRGSLYRTARVQLAQGEAFLREGHPIQAEMVLSKALATFHRFHDEDSVGTTCTLLGRSYVALGRPDEAVSAYEESVRVFGAVGDELARTQAVLDLEELAQRTTLPSDQQRRSNEIVAQVVERHYITRFSDALLRRFRRLALLGALPLTYILSFIAGLTLTLLLWVIESLFLLSRSGESITLDKAFVLMTLASLALLIPQWLYRLIYCLMGTAVVRVLGRRLSPIEREQPSHLVTSATGLTYHNASQGVSRTVLWTDVSAFASNDYHQRRRPLDLISSTFLALRSGEVSAVDGVTAGYRYLKQDIARHMGRQQDGVRQYNFNFVIFDTRWTVSAVAVSLILALVLRFLLGFQMTSYMRDSTIEVTLVLTPLMLSLVPTLLLVFPTVVLWRLLAQRLALRSALGYKARAIPIWILWLAALVATTFTVLWVVVLVLYALYMSRQ